MSALKEFANFITLNVANLAATYDRLLAENSESYITLPPDNRIAWARRLIKTVVEACESGTSEPLSRLFNSEAIRRGSDEAWKSSPTSRRLPHPLTEVECLGQTLTPVVTSLEAGKFLWQALSEVRATIFNSISIDSTPVSNLATQPELLAGNNNTANQAPETISQQLNLLPALIDSLPDYVYAKDAESRFILLNTATAHLLGASSPDEVIGKTDFDFFPPEIASQFRADEVALMQSGQPLLNHEEVIIDRETGEKGWNLATKIPFRNSQGEVIGLIGLNRNITERKRVEQTLQASQQRLSSLVQQSPLAIIEWNTAFEVADWNPAAERIFGYTREEALGRHAAGLLVPEEARPIVDQVWQELLAQKGGARSTNDNFTKDGRLITCDWYNTPLVGMEGQVIGVASLVDDITERKQAEEALRFTQFTVDRISLDAVWVGPEAQLLYVNDAACLNLGYSREELLSMTIYDINPALTPEMWLAHWAELKQRQTFTFDTQHRRNNGELYPVDVTVNYIEFNGLEYNCTLWQDITERKRLEQQIQGSLARLTRQIQAITEVAQQIAGTLTLNDLFQQVVDLMQSQFGYYHAQIYTMVEGEMTLQAGTGEVGRRLKERDHKIPLSAEQSLVIRAVWEGAPVLVTDASQEPTWLPNPLLPETKAELAVPITLGAEILGVLDVQSDELGGLNDEDQLLLVGLCGQIAIAIETRRADDERARLLTEVERRARREQTIREITEKMRAASSLEKLVKTAAEELGRRFSADLALVEFGIDKADTLAVVPSNGNFELLNEK